MTYKKIEVEPLTTPIGAVVHGVNLKEILDPVTVEDIKTALRERMVLYFPEQFIDAKELKALLEHFGQLADTRWAGRDESKFGNDRHAHFLRNKDDESFEETTFTNRAHIDKGASKYLVKVIGLCALEVPEYGGDTVFTSLYAAYEALSEPMKVLCDSLVGLYSPLRFEQVDQAVRIGQEGLDKLKMLEPAVERSLVHVHPETGRKALLVDNVWTWSIANLKPEEGEVVLSFLRHHCARPEFQCRVHWTPGGAAIWDNRCTTHLRVPDGFKGDRVLRRANVMSTEEVQAIGSAAE